MHGLLRALGVACVVAGAGTSSIAPASAQDTVKIGLIMAYTGQFADTATQMDNAIKLYIKQRGDIVAGKKIELIRRDSTGPDAAVAQRLARELVTRDGVDILAGFTLTPEALGAAAVSAEARKFMVVMNAATSIIITKSPYMARTSLTIPQLQEAFGLWAYKSGIRQIYSMVSDFGPGIDAEIAFQRGFKQAGGEIIASVRFPVANPDFSAFVQAAKDKAPESIFLWLPGGAQPAAIAKALTERGIDPKRTKVLGQGELTEDEARASMGDAGIGIITVYHYDHNHQSAANKAFVAAFNADYKRNPNVYSIGGWDGMHLIYEALKKTGGKADGESLIAAAKGMAWESPRGPISIDPETRDIVQTVYMRRVEKAGPGAGMGTLNVEFDKVGNVKDPVRK
jgi:branched-chain amino acid transport system substrate-binding protein